MSDERDVTLWPTRENYQRFRELCDDEIPETFDEFEREGLAIIDELGAQGVMIEKVAFNPDRMARWCGTHFGKVDSTARSAYAGFLALSD
jgi:hypothetical protein